MRIYYNASIPFKLFISSYREFEVQEKFDRAELIERSCNEVH
jgi:hypothetical protein